MQVHSILSTHWQQGQTQTQSPVRTSACDVPKPVLISAASGPATRQHLQRSQQLRPSRSTVSSPRRPDDSRKRAVVPRRRARAASWRAWNCFMRRSVAAESCLSCRAL